MADPIGSLRAEISASTAKFQKDLGKLRGQIDRFSKQSTRNMRSTQASFVGAASSVKTFIASFVGIAVVIRTLKGMADAAIEQKRVQAVLENQVEASGIAWEKYGSIIEKQIKTTADLAKVNDTVVRDTLSKLITASGNVAGSVENLTLAFDLARSSGASLDTVSRALGRAMKGDIAALQTYTAGIRDITQELGQQGSVTEKTNRALELLRNRVSGATEKYAEAIGPLQDFTKQWEDFSEEVGLKLVLPVITNIIKGFNIMTREIKKFFGVLPDGTTEMEELQIQIANTAEQMSELERINRMSGGTIPGVIDDYERLKNKLGELQARVEELREQEEIKPPDLTLPKGPPVSEANEIIKNQNKVFEALFKNRTEQQEKIGALIQSNAALNFQVQQEQANKEIEIQKNKNKVIELLNQQAIEAEQRRLQSYGNALGALAQLSDAFANTAGERFQKLLKVSQIFAAAQALVNTYLAASQTLADPRLGFFEKFAAVAATIAAGLNLVASIKSLNPTASTGGAVSGGVVDGRSLQESNGQGGSITVINYIDGIISDDKMDEVVNNSLGPKLGKYIKDNGGVIGPIRIETRRK